MKKKCKNCHWLGKWGEPYGVDAPGMRITAWDCNHPVLRRDGIITKVGTGFKPYRNLPMNEHGDCQYFRQSWPTTFWKIIWTVFSWKTYKNLIGKTLK